MEQIIVLVTLIVLVMRKSSQTNKNRDDQVSVRRFKSQCGAVVLRLRNSQCSLGNILTHWPLVTLTIYLQSVIITVKQTI